MIHVDCQDPLDPSHVMVWTIEQREGPVPKRTVQIFGTGQPLPFDAEHLGSAMALDGRLVWHVFALSASVVSEVVRSALTEKQERE